MNLQLQHLRKAAGYKSRASMAAALGISERKLKAWETQETRITFDDACMIADFLGCSLDELAGRISYVGTYADDRQAQINNDFMQLSNGGKDAAAGAVRGMLLTERSNKARKKAGEDGLQGSEVA